MTDRLFLNEKVKLVSLLQPVSDSQNNVYFNQLYSAVSDLGSNRMPMELDKTKISIWIEYFCRYDESKYWSMSSQLQMSDEQLM